MAFVVQWIRSNKVTLNINNCYMIFHGMKEMPTNISQISVNNKLVAREDIAEFLGVILDSKFTHKKISKQYGILHLIGDFLTDKCLKLLSNYSLIYPQLAMGATKQKRFLKTLKKII